MIKNKTIIEAKVGERTYQMECFPESPLGEVYDALNQMRAYVIERIVDQQKSEKAQAIEPDEIVKEV